MADALIGTAVPILLLMGIGFLSRKFGILKLGDERVLSAYVYYFALPALFFVDLSETSFVAETLSFILAGIIPIFVVMAIYVLLYVLFRFSKNVLSFSVNFMLYHHDILAILPNINYSGMGQKYNRYKPPD